MVLGIVGIVEDSIRTENILKVLEKRWEVTVLLGRDRSSNCASIRCRKYVAKQQFCRKGSSSTAEHILN